MYYFLVLLSLIYYINGAPTEHITRSLFDPLKTDPKCSYLVDIILPISSPFLQKCEKPISDLKKINHIDDYNGDDLLCLQYYNAVRNLCNIPIAVVQNLLKDEILQKTLLEYKTQTAQVCESYKKNYSLNEDLKPGIEVINKIMVEKDMCESICKSYMKSTKDICTLSAYIINGTIQAITEISKKLKNPKPPLTELHVSLSKEETTKNSETPLLNLKSTSNTGYGEVVDSDSKIQSIESKTKAAVTNFQEDLTKTISIDFEGNDRNKANTATTVIDSKKNDQVIGKDNKVENVNSVDEIPKKIPKKEAENNVATDTLTPIKPIDVKQSEVQPKPDIQIENKNNKNNEVIESVNAKIPNNPELPENPEYKETTLNGEKIKNINAVEEAPPDAKSPNIQEDPNTNFIDEEGELENEIKNEYLNEEIPQPKSSEVKSKMVEKAKPLEIDEDASNIAVNFENQNIDDSDSYFFSYFMMVCIMFICGYVAYHNKQKILALVVEGRKGRRPSRTRRPNSANYRKLDSNLEEAVTSSCNKNATQVIY